MVSVPVDVHLVAQTALYFTAVGAGLVVSIPTALVTSDYFNGHCVLYMDIKWVNATYMNYTFGHPFTCHYVTYVTALACVIFGAALGIYYGYAVYRSRSDENIALEMWVMPFVLSSSLVSTLVFIAACILSVGYTVLCRSFTSGRDSALANIKSCQDAMKWNWNQDGSDYNASTFIDFLTVSQTACWVCFFVWLAQLALTILRYYRNRRHRSSESFQGSIPTSDLRQIAAEDPTA